jgi:uncharacterized protein (DUF1697 family)
MARYVALLRAINVGGTGKLPMAVLRSMCVAAGFTDVQTYIASGNVVFTSTGRAESVKAKLEARLRNNAGKPIGVIVRTANEMADILKANPFRTTDPKTTYVVFLNAAPADNPLETATGRVDEQMRLGRREIYIYYPHGMGRSKLRVPSAKTGTARNLNTVAALVKLAYGEQQEPSS